MLELNAPVVVPDGDAVAPPKILPLLAFAAPKVDVPPKIGPPAVAGAAVAPTDPKIFPPLAVLIPKILPAVVAGAEAPNGLLGAGVALGAAPPNIEPALVVVPAVGADPKIFSVVEVALAKG